MTCRGECTGRQGSYRHVRGCVDALDPRGHHIVKAEHDLRITEHVNEQTGVVTYSWTCSCPFAFGFGLPTKAIALQMAEPHNVVDREERRRMPVTTIVKQVAR